MYVPASHAKHDVPSTPVVCPSAHLHSEMWLLPGMDDVFVGQTAHVADPTSVAEYVPASHGRHATAPALACIPALHGAHASGLTAPVKFENDPAGHGVQLRLTLQAQLATRMPVFPAALEVAGQS